MNNYEHRDNSNRNNFREREDENKTQLFVAKGRNHGMDQGSLIEFISHETKTDPSKFSNVKILDDFSFFAVSHSEADIILDYFQAKAGDGRPLVSKAKRKTADSRSGGGFRRDDRRESGFRNDRGGDRREGGFGGGNDRREGGFGGGNYNRDNNRGGYSKPRRNSDY